MKYLLLKFNHGVEIGAKLAYLGHYQRTKDPIVFNIAMEEEKHKDILAQLLKQYGYTSSKFIDNTFTIIGSVIAKFCKVAPIFMLNFVARIMEIFAVFSYNKLSRLYPLHRRLFEEMSLAEERHEKYFTQSKDFKVNVLSSKK